MKKNFFAKSIDRLSNRRINKYNKQVEQQNREAQAYAAYQADTPSVDPEPSTPAPQSSKPLTATDAILQYLLAGEIMTVRKAWKLCGTSELRCVVARLRKRGHNIISTKVPGEIFNQYYIQ